MRLTQQCNVCNVTLGNYVRNLCENFSLKIKLLTDYKQRLIDYGHGQVFQSPRILIDIKMLHRCGEMKSDRKNINIQSCSLV